MHATTAAAAAAAASQPACLQGWHVISRTAHVASYVKNAKLP
jgi:hypothetical protein